MLLPHARRRMAATASADWAQEDKRRLLHAVYRVGDLNKTIEVYQKAFGLKLLRSRDVPDVRMVGWCSQAVAGVASQRQGA